MERSINIFKDIQFEVKRKIFFNIQMITIDNHVDEEYKRNNIERLYRRLDNLDEVTMKYILVSVKNCLFGSTFCLDFLKKYNFESKIIDSDFNLKFYENCLKEAFDYFQCPGILPSIDDINKELSYFNYVIDNDISTIYSALERCDGDLFDNLYNVGISNGMSKEDIFLRFSKIFSMLQYYHYVIPGHSVLNYVPFLDSEIDNYFKYKCDNFSLLSK